jgi:hypothetical protein
LVKNRSLLSRREVSRGQLQWMPPCFAPQGAGAAVVMLVGPAGAAVTGGCTATHARHIDPVRRPMTLLLLKLPTGAPTALLGLVLLHGEFVPGLSALDSSDQILAWSLVFGAAQQPVTGLVDKKAQTVLDSVGSTR